MFSVIIPLYNKAAYIEKAIRSVVAQTYKEFELIVIDDGSKDEGWEIAQTLFSTLTPPLGGWVAIQQQNQGVSTARNNGVKLAKYDYIAFLDADDWWEPTYLEEMRALIDEYPEAGLYGSSYCVVKNNSKRLVRLGVEPDFKNGIINYFKVYAKTLEMPIWTGATIIKNDIFVSENGFKPQLKLGEDFDLWVRVALKYPVALLNKPLSNYNFDVESTAKAVVNDKTYLPQTHFIFNLDFLEENERTNQDLKDLLDKLRVYTLLRYRLQHSYLPEVEKEIKKVDFSHQVLSVRLNYFLPVWILNCWYDVQKFAHSFKKYLLE